RNGKFNCTNVCGTIKLKENHNPYFVAHVLKLESKKFVSINLANPKLMNNVMNDIKINLPEAVVQNKIARFLLNIDKKISIESRIHMLLIEQKQYLLSNLF